MVWPKVTELVYQELAELENDITNYLGYIDAIAEAKDDIIRRFLMEDAPEIPEPYQLWIKLKRWANGGAVPFLLPGGYFDQPYMTMQQLEVCARAEANYSSLPSMPSDQNSLLPPN